MRTKYALKCDVCHRESEICVFQFVIDAPKPYYVKGVFGRRRGVVQAKEDIEHLIFILRQLYENRP